uniref:Odorant receptor n=1 Tax=Chrysomela lapponica TaxID=153811 RepID=A0A310S603_CHRLA
MMPRTKILKWTDHLLLAAGASHPTPRGPYSIPYHAWTYLSQANFLFFCVSLGAGAMNTKAAKDELDRNEAFLLLCLLLLWKLAICRGSRMREIVGEARRVEVGIPAGDHEMGRMYDRSASSNHGVFFFLAAIYFTSCSVCIFNGLQHWQLMRKAGAEMEKSLVIVAWFPFDYSGCFDLVYFYQICSIALIPLYCTAFDSLFISLMNSATARLAILGYKMESFKEQSTLEGQSTYHYLRDVVMEHKNVMRYVEDLNESLKWFLFVDFLSRSYHVSLTIMNIVRHRSEGPIFFDFSTIIYLLSQIICFYYHANRLILESTSLSMKIFHSEWLDQSPEVKRSLLIVMARSQKPLVLTIGNFRVMDNNLLVQIVKAGYTFFLYQLLDILH